MPEISCSIRCVHSLPKSLAFAIAAGACFAASFPPVSIWPIGVLGPALLAWTAMHASSGWRTFWVSWLAFTLAWAFLDRWMIDVTALGHPALVAYLGLTPALFAIVVRRIHRHPRLGAWPMMLVVPIVWVGSECLRGRAVLDGYPWFYLGHPWVEWPLLAQSADLLGVPLVSTIAAMLSGLLVDAAGVAFGHRPRRWLVVPAVVVMVALLANMAYGAFRLGQYEDATAPTGPTVLAIQTNLPTENKIGWTPEMQRRDIPEFINQTIAALEAARSAGTRIDLVAWPETMLPGYGLAPETLATYDAVGERHYRLFAGAMNDLVNAMDVPFLVGSSAADGLYLDGQRWAWAGLYNSAFLCVPGEEPVRYDKVVLTPMGETMPYISKLEWLEEALLSLGAAGMAFNLEAADEPRLLTLPGDGSTTTLATPICFEVTVAPLCRQMVYEQGRKRADLFVNLSNDGWFGSHDDGRARHAQIARFRCIENRVPMVRAVNTGYSLSIDSAGRFVGHIGEGPRGTARVAGALTATPRTDERETLYARTGEAWAWITLGLTILLVARTVPGNTPVGSSSRDDAAPTESPS